MHKLPYKQRGVALIMAVVAVAIVALIAVAMTSDQNLLVRRVQNTVLVDSAWQYALGGEQFAALALKKEQEEGIKNNKSYDSPIEAHLSEQFIFPLENVGGTISGNLEELQGRFNLTNLLTDDGGVDLDAAPAFERLLVILGISPDAYNVVMDWIDADQQELPNGAEDTYYQTLERPYLAANQPFSSLEELRLLKGFDQPVNQNVNTPSDAENVETVFDVLAKHVVVLPTRTELNVNTATPEVLRAYFNHINAANANKLVEKAQSEEPFTSVSDFKGHNAAAASSGKTQDEVFKNTPTIDVRSEYFAANLRVELGGIETPLYSVLRRNLDTGKVHVVRRTRGKI